MSTSYEAGVVAWANEQAALHRAGKFSQLDIEQIADEAEDVGKSGQRELKRQMANLLADLLKWQFQPERRGANWQVSIRSRHKELNGLIQKSYWACPTRWSGSIAILAGSD